MHPEGLTGKEDAVGPAGHEILVVLSVLKVCFTPSCSAAVCDWSCTGKERQRPALLVLAKEHRGWPRLV